jgi:tetratricopeptide (TPR) repeat protein
MLERDISYGGGVGQELHYSMLGYVYACLGLKEEAIRAGERAVEILPVSKDAFDGADLAVTLAEIYAKVGEYEAAIDQLEWLLSIPSSISVPSIRLDPIWDPLRGIPRFQRMLEKHEESS